MGADFSALNQVMNTFRTGKLYSYLENNDEDDKNWININLLIAFMSVNIPDVEAFYFIEYLLKNLIEPTIKSKSNDFSKLNKNVSEKNIIHIMTLINRNDNDIIKSIELNKNERNNAIRGNSDKSNTKYTRYDE